MGHAPIAAPQRRFAKHASDGAQHHTCHALPKQPDPVLSGILKVNFGEVRAPFGAFTIRSPGLL